MAANTEKQKTVAVFDPEQRSRAVIIPMLQSLGYKVDEHHDSKKIINRCKPGKRADLLFVHLAVFGNKYQDVTSGLEELHLGSIEGCPPVLAISALKLSEEAKRSLEKMGCAVVLSRRAPLLEVMFAINRLLFPKIRELRRYSRVFAGFPVQFGDQDEWLDGVVYNISTQGAFVKCDSPPREGTQMQLRFILPQLDVPFEVTAMVSWVNQQDKSADPISPPGMGISFLSLNSEAKATLGRFIEERQDSQEADE